MIEIETNGFKGLGSNLQHLSMLNYSNQNIKITTNTGWYDFFKRLVETLNLEKIQLIENNNITDFNYCRTKMTAYDKFFCPYITTDVINYQGKEYQTGKTGKKSIFLACYQNLGSEHILTLEDFKQPEGTFKFPRNRYYSIEEYAKIFLLFKKAGYDVITLDQKIPIDEKIYLLNNYCECLVGYEGGMCHLAHVLKIPCIILPWQKHMNGWKNKVDIETKNPQGMNWKLVHSVHLDTKTYFLNSIDELLDMSIIEIEQLIKNLQENKGNNFFLRDDINFTMSLKNKTYNYIDLDGNLKKGLFFDFVSLSAWEFITNYYTDLKIAGIKEIIWE